MSLSLPRNVLLGVTGSIAAYKSAALVRELVKAGARVRVRPDFKLNARSAGAWIADDYNRPGG